MIPDIDIWRCAALMIKRYGDLADIEAATRADEFQNQATRTLNILQSALEEMRIQIGQLVPTESKPTHRSRGNAVSDQAFTKGIAHGANQTCFYDCQGVRDQSLISPFR